MELWVYKALAVFCSAMAGWALGRASPTWEADVDSVEHVQGHGWGWGYGWGLRSRLVSGNSASCTTGTGAFVGWVVSTLAMHHMGWPTGVSVFDELGMLESLLRASMLMLLIIFIGTYAYARFTDTGPVGPID